jgi:hypothetical protein
MKANKTHKDYSEVFLAKLRLAGQGTHPTYFTTEEAANSFQRRMQHMSKAIQVDETADHELRKASWEVAWGVPKEGADGRYMVVGSVRRTPGVSLEQILNEIDQNAG